MSVTERQRKLKGGNRKMAGHQLDLQFLTVLEISRHSCVDGYEHAGIWTDTWFCLECVSALPFTSSVRPAAKRSHSPLNSGKTPLSDSGEPHSRRLPTRCEVFLHLHAAMTWKVLVWSDPARTSMDIRIRVRNRGVDEPEIQAKGGLNEQENRWDERKWRSLDNL